jgi:hypothetical protein
MPERRRVFSRRSWGRSGPALRGNGR